VSAPERKDVIRLGVLQPRAYAGGDGPRMLEEALGHIEEAGRMGVDLLVFPETYPGPTTHEVRYDAIGPISEAAAAAGVGVVAGTTEEVPGADGTYYVSAVVIGADGHEVGRYRRTHPRSEVYAGIFGNGPFWHIDYQAADELPVFDMGWGVLGVSICSECFVPEVARAMALQGAEVCVFPTGVLIDDFGFTDNWRTMVRARAIENIMYTATTMNLFPDEMRQAACSGELAPSHPETGLNRGHAMIAGPEAVLATSPDHGILATDLDLARLRRMRSEPEFPEGVVIPPPFASLPSVLDLRRPELVDLAVAGQPATSGAAV
jgi:predicted amidohydrolase